MLARYLGQSSSINGTYYLTRNQIEQLYFPETLIGQPVELIIDQYGPQFCFHSSLWPQYGDNSPLTEIMCVRTKYSAEELAQILGVKTKTETAPLTAPSIVSQNKVSVSIPERTVVSDFTQTSTAPLWYDLPVSSRASAPASVSNPFLPPSMQTIETEYGPAPALAPVKSDVEKTGELPRPFPWGLVILGATLLFGAS